MCDLGIRKINQLRVWRNAENRSYDWFASMSWNVIEENVKRENITVMQVYVSCHRQMHDLGWISAYSKEGIVWDTILEDTNF